MVDKEKDQYAIDIITALASRTITRLWITIVLLIVLFVVSNAWWVWRESQYADIETTQTVEQDTDGGGDNSFVGGDYYGSSESDYDG